MNCWPSGKYVHLLYMYSILALIMASIRRGMEVISLWHCWGGMEAQVSLTVAFSSSAFFGLLFLIFLLTIPHRFSMGFKSGEFAGTPTPWSFNQLLVLLAVWAGFQKTQWTNTSRWHCTQIITDCGNLTLDFKQLGLWASPPFLQTLGPWFPN